MLCQECQEFPATISFMKFVKGEKMQIHLCRQCAYKYRKQNDKDEQLAIHDMLKELFDVSYKNDFLKQENELSCKHCEMTLSEFKNKGKLGCHKCYQTFSEQLKPILKRVHIGNTKHIGKLPRRKETRFEQINELEELRQRILVCIEEENFEEAAIIRDRIKELEKSVDDEGGGRH